MYPFTLHTLQARYAAVLNGCARSGTNFLKEASFGLVEPPLENGQMLVLEKSILDKHGIAIPPPGSIPRERGSNHYDLSFGGKQLPWDMTPDETHFTRESAQETYEQEQLENETNYER